MRRSSNYLKGKGVYDSNAKTASSIRSIKVPLIAIEMLQEYRTWQIEQRLMIGDRWINSNRVFTNWNGVAITPTYITTWFSRFVQHSDLPPINIHSLRHTNATLQIAGGVPLPTVANRLGHASTAVTSQIYVHAIQSADQVAADTIEDLLSPGKKRSKSS